MRIRETKEETKTIDLKRACVYHMSDSHANAAIQNPAHNMAVSDGYIPKTLDVNTSMGFAAKFKTTVEREMTPAEEQAYHFLKAFGICNTDVSCDKCEFMRGLICPIHNVVAVSERILEGKEVIE